MTLPTHDRDESIWTAPRRLGPEEMLLVKVFERAVRDYLEGSRRDESYRSAESYLFSDALKDKGLFCIENVCEVMGIEVLALRQNVKKIHAAWKALAPEIKERQRSPIFTSL